MHSGSESHACTPTSPISTGMTSSSASGNGDQTSQAAAVRPHAGLLHTKSSVINNRHACTGQQQQQQRGPSLPRSPQQQQRRKPDPMQQQETGFLDLWISNGFFVGSAAVLLVLMCIYMLATFDA